MNNPEADKIIDDCIVDLNRVKSIVDSLGQTASVVPYLNRYSIVKACGSLEQAYKTIIADYCSYRSKQQIKNFLDKRIRDNSSNPSYGNICNSLKQFDEDWNRDFKNEVSIHPNKQNILDGLQSLVDARNEFAHGGNPNISINDTITYFNNSCVVIRILDQVVS